MRGRRHRLPRGIELAPRRRRFAAGVIDGGLIPSAFAAPIGLYVALRHRLPAKVKQRVLPAPPASAVRSATAVLSVALRGRSPGYRWLGLSRVEARTGRPASAQRVLVFRVIEEALGDVLAPLYMPGIERVAQDPKAAAARERDVDAHTDRAINGTAAVGCGLRTVATLLVPWLSSFASPLRQMPAERIAGIVVVRER